MSDTDASPEALRNLKAQLGDRPVGLVGLGLIGGSIGLDLAALGIDTVALVHRDATAERARQRNLAREVSTDPAVLGNAGIVLLCLPLDRLLEPPQELLKALPQNAVVSDVGSVKEPVLAVWSSLHRRFVGGHPMAGTAEAGVNAGQAGLFRGKPWVLTTEAGVTQADGAGQRRSRSATEQAVDRQLLEVLVYSLGARVVSCTAADHDRAVALISHLPVLVSAALLHTVDAEPDAAIRTLARQLASSGFGDTTRVGGGNPALGTLMAEKNKEALTGALELYRNSLEQLAESVGSGNWSHLSKELNRAREQRKAMLAA